MHGINSTLLVPENFAFAFWLVEYILGWAPGERAATVWLDDAAVHIANGTHVAH